MSKRQKSKPALDFEQIEMIANFSDIAANYPKLPFRGAANKLRVDFHHAKNGKAWEKECRSVFERERS
jgi:hypothetical protein